MKFISFALCAIILGLLPLVADVDDHIRTDSKAKVRQYSAELGDVVFGGATYGNAVGTCWKDGTVRISGSNGSKSAQTTVAWDKLPWDVRKKLEPVRAALIADINSAPRIYAKPAALALIWGAPVPTTEKPLPSMEQKITVQQYNTAEYAIYAHFSENGAVMLDIAPKQEWTAKSMEAVLKSSDPRQRWSYSSAQDAWVGSKGSRARMFGPRLRIMTTEFLKLRDESPKSSELPAKGI